MYFSFFLNYLTSFLSTLGSSLGLNTHFEFFMCIVHVLYCVCNFACCVLSCFLYYCSTTAIGYKSICNNNNNNNNNKAKAQQQNRAQRGPM